MKAHLLVFDSSQVSQKTVQNAIDRVAAVANWYSIFDNAPCLASDAPAKEPTRLTRAVLPDRRFIVVTVDPDEKGGWMPKPIWSSLNDLQSADVEAA